MFNKIIENGQKILDSTEDKISKVKDKVIDYIPDINIDYIEEKLEYIGYRIPRVEISITIPPRISFEIDLEKSNIDDLRKKEIEEDIDIFENEEVISDRILVKIIQGLDSAIKLKEKIKFKSKKLSRINVEGSIIPTVTLVYLDNKEISLENRKD